jgi:hypothetical protein
MGCQAIGTVRVAIVFPTAWHAPLPFSFREGSAPQGSAGRARPLRRVIAGPKAAPSEASGHCMTDKVNPGKHREERNGGHNSVWAGRRQRQGSLSGPLAPAGSRLAPTLSWLRCASPKLIAPRRRGQPTVCDAPLNDYREMGSSLEIDDFAVSCACRLTARRGNEQGSTTSAKLNS